MQVSGDKYSVTYNSENPFVEKLWSKFNIITKEHFYHVGAKEDNRNSMLEALVMNFEVKKPHEEMPLKIKQLVLF